MSTLRDAILSAAIFLVVWASHFGGEVRTTTDSLWFVHTAISILKEGDTDLDEYRALFPRNAGYTVEQRDGHWYNVFPIGTALVALPVVWLMDQASTLGFTPDLEAFARETIPLEGIEVLVASLVVALTAVIVYHTARLSLPTVPALALAFIFAFCTSAWSTASRALWQHGPSMLMLASALFLALRAGERPALAQFVSLPLALAYVIRPTNSLAVLGFTLWLLVEHRRWFWRYVGWAATVALPFFAYNLSLYHAPLPPYFAPQRVGSSPHVWEALAGNLVSPARGLLVFSPVLAFAIVGAFLKVRRREFRPLDGCLVAVVLGHWLAISSFPHWWGGHSFGPRLFSDMLPFLVPFLIPTLQHLPSQPRLSRTVLASAFLLSVAASFFIHFRGATVWETWFWNTQPVDVDQQPARLWEWRDPQFLRAVRVVEP